MFRVFFLFFAFLAISAAESTNRCKSFPFGTWMRSQEEDKDPNADWLLYRHGSYNFPPARGRSGVIVKKDGRFALLGPSAVDGRDTTWGSWKKVSEQEMAISVEGSALNSLKWKPAGKGKLLISLK